MAQDNNKNHQEISEPNASNKALGIDDSWIEKI